jgi:hypothetical protein
MVGLDSVLVVVAATLAGGFNRTLEAPSCAEGSRWRECPVLDATIHPVHILVPWAVTLATIVVLGMPSVLLHSKGKEQALRVFAGNLFKFLGLLSCSTLVADHPSVCYTLTIHACVRLLASMEGLMQRVTVLALLAAQVCEGPAISVVHWPGAEQGALSCAYLAHLVGCVVPDLVLAGMRALVASARYIHVGEGPAY